MCLDVGPDTKDRTLSHGEHVGFEFQTVHNRMGYRCGYIRVLPGHPWFEMSYDDINDLIDYKVHGGLTFTHHGTACPTHGQADEWWIGFDCAHAGDAPDPELPYTRGDVMYLFRILGDAAEPYGVVRSQEYVDAECRKLAEMAAAA